MEIRNILFGCSRGEYPVDRATYELAFSTLLFVMKIRKFIDSPSYPDQFENGVFAINPYYCGDCTCGWDYIDNGHNWIRGLEHWDTCFQCEYDDLCRRYPLFGDAFERELASIFRKHGWDTISPNWQHGCALRCTCDYPERWKRIYEWYALEFGHKGHKPNCELEKPNFFYKKTGYSLKWYKYPLRDSYANWHLELKEFEAMIDDCIRSLDVPGVKHQTFEEMVDDYIRSLGMPGGVKYQPMDLIQ